MFPGALVGPYVQPPDHAFCFTCRCGHYFAVIRYRVPHVVEWMVYNSWMLYCSRCGTRLGQSGRTAFLDDMVRWARAKSHGVRFLGLKEWEAREEAQAERWTQDHPTSPWGHRPTPAEFTEGGH